MGKRRTSHCSSAPKGSPSRSPTQKALLVQDEKGSEGTRTQYKSDVQSA